MKDVRAITEFLAKENNLFKQQINELYMIAKQHKEVIELLSKRLQQHELKHEFTEGKNEN